MELIKGLLQEPQRIIFYGPEGIGKSTLASQLPDPIFIDTEGSTGDLDVIRTPPSSVSSWRAIVDTVSGFIGDHQGARSLIVDTADWAEKRCIAHVCDTNNLTSLGGQDDFGRSYNLHETEWLRFLDSLSRVAASGMHVGITAHAGIKHTCQPGMENGYDRWELKMERKTAAATKEWARTVLFLNYKIYVVEGKDKKKRGTGGHRVIHTSHTPAFDAKNRAGLPDEMRLEYKAIERLFLSGTSPSQSGPAATPPSSPQALAEPPSTPSPPAKTPEPKQAESSKPTPTEAGGQLAFLGPLFDLMKRDGVSEREVQLAIAKRGYYPADTPIGNYDPQFVAGKLVAFWPQVQKLVNQIRQEAAQ